MSGGNARRRHTDRFEVSALENCWLGIFIDHFLIFAISNELKHRGVSWIILREPHYVDRIVFSIGEGNKANGISLHKTTYYRNVIDVKQRSTF